MFTIRPEQMRALTFPVRRAILIEHARSAHPAAAAAQGQAGLEEMATNVVRRCFEYGLEATADQMRMMGLALVFGADWRRPDLRWLDEGMRDQGVAEPSLRLRKVWRSALRRLAREI